MARRTSPTTETPLTAPSTANNGQATMANIRGRSNSFAFFRRWRHPRETISHKSLENDPLDVAESHHMVVSYRRRSFYETSREFMKPPSPEDARERMEWPEPGPPNKEILDLLHQRRVWLQNKTEPVSVLDTSS